MQTSWPLSLYPSLRGEIASASVPVAVFSVVVASVVVVVPV